MSVVGLAVTVGDTVGVTDALAVGVAVAVDVVLAEVVGVAVDPDMVTMQVAAPADVVALHVAGEFCGTPVVIPNVTDEPAAIEPFHASLLMITLVAVEVLIPLHAVTEPTDQGMFTVQEDTACVPALVTVAFTVCPPDHAVWARATRRLFAVDVAVGVALTVGLALVALAEGLTDVAVAVGVAVVAVGVGVAVVTEADGVGEALVGVAVGFTTQVAAVDEQAVGIRAPLTLEVAVSPKVAVAPGAMDLA